jgi:hypothetical protein
MSKPTSLFCSLLGILPAVGGLFFATQSQAITISWGTGVAAVMVTSDGSSITEPGSPYKFEIGYFANTAPSTAFVPTASNLNQWGLYWRPWDVAMEGSGFSTTTDYVTRNQTFSGSSTTVVTTLYGQSYTIPTGSQGYMWVFNEKTVEQGSEWALLTNRPGDGASGDWLFPNPALESGPDDPQWRMGSEGDMGTVGTVVFGRAANNLNSGAGSFTANPSTFDIQLSAVPEPSSSMLLLGSLAASLARRRRRV